MLTNVILRTLAWVGAMGALSIGWWSFMSIEMDKSWHELDLLAQGFAQLIFVLVAFVVFIFGVSAGLAWLYDAQFPTLVQDQDMLWGGAAILVTVGPGLALLKYNLAILKSRLKQ